MRPLLLLPAILALLAFPYGPMFPWSPWKPGYVHTPLSRADIYGPAGVTLPEPYRHVDEYIALAEIFHQLKISKRILIVGCANWSDFSRFHPLIGKPGAVTLATGTVIYVTPRITERGFDHGEFLRHEISHAVLHQNQSILNALRIGRGDQQWLSEGLAVWFGDQKTYNTRAQFLDYARSKPLAGLIDPMRRAPDFDIRYGYVAWHHFNEYLVATKGRAAYQSYLLACMARPGGWRGQFPASFGDTFDAAIENFERALRTNTWLPPS